MAAFVKFDKFVHHLGLGYHDMNAHVFKIYLTNNTPSNSADVWRADLAGATEANNYAAAAIDHNWTETGGLASFKANSYTWTANGGNFGPFEWVVLFNDNATDGNNVDGLIGYWDYGSSISCNNGESFTWQTPANNLIANLT